MAAVRSLIDEIPFRYASRRKNDIVIVAGQIAGLLHSVGAGPPQFRDFVAGFKRRNHYRIDHPGALLTFVRQDLDRLVPRKPPRSTVLRAEPAEPMPTFSREEHIASLESTIALFRDEDWPEQHPSVKQLKQQLAALKQPLTMAAGGSR